jgi:class 3 adenylate cyclase/tetratricopeptide (TPR) repeat protein
MTSPDILEKLAAYVPMPVAQAIYGRPDVLTGPFSRRFPAAVLFTDISGFTLLSELLSQAGPTGAEELTQLINQYFTQTIQIIQAYHGQVVKFSGDAVMVLFPAEEISMTTAVRRAADCALAMQANMGHFVDINTSRGHASLSIKVGIGAGNVLECSIGGALGRWEYVVAGDPLVQVAMAEHQAEPGQVVVSPPAWRIAERHFVGVANTSQAGFVTIHKALKPLPKLEPLYQNWRQLSPQKRQLAAEALQCYIPGAIKARLHEQAEWLAELRRMAILFVGIGGIDYEAPDAADRLQNFIQAAQEVIYRFEGSLGKVAVDDKGTILLILFGAPPFFHEDDATRAVACALGLQAVAREQNLKMAIGIAEGSIFSGPVGAPNRREYTVIGDDVNLAARLMQYGRGGTIIISERVKDRAGSQFVTESLGQISLRGKAQALTAYLVKGEQGTQEAFVSRYILHQDPLVGRKTELEQLRRLAGRARAGALQLLFVEGELGLGKSRLAAELVHEWIMAGQVGYGSKCISYGQQIPYQAWRQVLAAIFGLSPSLPPHQQLARLATSVAALDDPPNQPDYWVDRLPLLADVVGLEAPENDFTRSISSKLRRDNTFALIEAILRRQLTQHPVLILLEDVQWADELSLSLVAYLAQKLVDTPLLLVLIHRPVLKSGFHALGHIYDLPYVHTIQLEPLSDQESLDLIRILLGNRSLSPKAEEILLNRGQGNPFFLQEITGAILDVMDGQEKSSFETLETIDLPETVQDVIFSRVDKLAEAEKLTLKIASVIGSTFQRSLLSEVHPITDARYRLPAHLDKLEHEKLIRLEIPAPKWEYVFRNVITQEVVYEGLLLAQRRQLHSMVATTLEVIAPDEVEQLAFHYSRSGKNDKALHYLKIAGKKAQREHANYAAINYYSEILKFLTNGASGGNHQRSNLVSVEYWDILLERVKLYQLVGARDEALEDLGTLGIMAEALNHDRRRALAARQWANFYEASGDYDSALELVERSIQLAQKAGDDKLLGEIYNHRGKLLYMRGDFETAHDYLQRAWFIAQEQKDKIGQADCMNSLGMVAHYQADYAVALYFFQEALELSEAMGDLVGLGNGLHNLGRVHYDMGEYVTAQQCYEQAHIRQRNIGNRAGQVLTQYSLAKIHRTLGNYDTARRMFEESLAFYQSAADRHYETYTLYHLGFLHCRLGEYKKALTFLEEAIFNLRELNDLWGLTQALAYQGWTLQANGRYDEARTSIIEALKIGRETRQNTAMMEYTALLGKIALSIGDITLAYACAQQALNFINRHGTQGIEHPAMVYLTCYHILQTNQKYDEATSALEQGHQYLQTQAARLDDSQLRASFLNNVAENREIIELIMDNG